MLSLYDYLISSDGVPSCRLWVESFEEVQNILKNNASCQGRVVGNETDSHNHSRMKYAVSLTEN